MSLVFGIQNLKGAKVELAQRTTVIPATGIVLIFIKMQEKNYLL